MVRFPYHEFKSKTVKSMYEALFSLSVSISMKKDIVKKPIFNYLEVWCGFFGTEGASFPAPKMAGHQ